MEWGSLPNHGVLKGVNVLLVEDDHTFEQALLRHLKKEGAWVVSAPSISEGRTALLCDRRFDVLIVDRMLPDGDGHQVLLRETAGRVPTRIALSAFFDTTAWIAANLLGGIVVEKDGRVFERILAAVATGRPSSLGELEPLARHLSAAGLRIRFTRREIALLRFLTNRAGQWLDSPRIAHEVFDRTDKASLLLVWQYVKRLRQKIPRCVLLIEHERANGYCVQWPQTCDPSVRSREESSPHEFRG